MAYKAAAVIGLLDNRNRFADLFNGTWFQGVQVVKPEELEDTSGETHVLVEDKRQELEEVHRYRDVTMKWKQGINLMVLACEIQNKVHAINKNVCNIDTNDLRFYLSNYQNTRNSSKITLDNIRRIMSSFFSWLEDEDYIRSGI